MLVDYTCENQMSIFDILDNSFCIDKPIRLIELFAGVGSQAMALRNIGADFKHHRVVEFDKYAIASYNAIHGTGFTTMDITKVKGTDLGIEETDKYCYIMTYSFPCQDLSVAGKMQGMSKGSGTRSGLLWEVERLLNEVENLPQVLLMENVPQVHSKANMPDFQKWIAFLESKGYSNFWQDLNAKNYGVAQNRNRTFMVSILGNYKYEFPKPIPLTKVMKDYLEEKVDEKYYINNEKAQQLIDNLVVEGTIPESRAEQSRAEQSRAEQSRAGASTSQSISPGESISQTQLQQERIGASVNVDQRRVVCCHMNKKRIDKTTDMAKTLCARDYKGFGTGFDTMNGIIEWK